MLPICPACGAQVQFKSRFSTTTVCVYCQTLLVRQNDLLFSNGKMATLAEDFSFLQVGTKGCFHGTTFEIIGQLKVHWRDGYWNEWYVLEEEGTVAWIGEAMGFLTYSHEIELSANNLRENYQVGNNLCLNGIDFVINDIKNFEVASCLGELPFTIQQNREGLSIDLASFDERTAHIEIMNHQIRAYQGKNVTFEELQLSNVRVIDGW